MSENTDKAGQAPPAPGVCIPWPEQMERLGEIKGDASIIKNEWEKIDTLAYLYLWYWVHR